MAAGADSAQARGLRGVWSAWALGKGGGANLFPFFLTSIQHVYGAQHPPFDPLSHGT